MKQKFKKILPIAISSAILGISLHTCLSLNPERQSKPKIIIEIPIEKPLKKFKKNQLKRNSLPKIAQRTNRNQENPNDLYAALFPTLIQCNEQKNYTPFLNQLSKIKTKYEYPEIPSDLISENAPSISQINAFIDNNIDTLLEDVLTHGSLLEASILIWELGYPEEITKALYEKRREIFKDERVSKQFKREILQKIAVDLWLSYINYGYAAGLGSGEKGQMRERFKELVKAYAPHISFDQLDLARKNLSIDFSQPDLSSHLYEALKKKEHALQQCPSLDSLEEIIKSYELLKDLYNTRGAALHYLNQTMETELKAENTIIIQRKLENLRSYLPESSYHFWKEQIEKKGN